MREHTYIVTYIAADGQSKTESVIGRSHDAVVRFIEKQGGRVVHLDRDDETRSPSSRSVRHDVWAIVLFVLAAIAIVAYWWHKMR